MTQTVFFLGLWSSGSRLLIFLLRGIKTKGRNLVRRIQYSSTKKQIREPKLKKAGKNRFLILRMIRK